MNLPKVRVALTLFLGGMLSLHILIAWNSRDLIRKGYPDFTIFYSAGKIVRQGLGKQLYDESTQYRAEQEFAAGVTIRQGPLPYNHPPFEALIFVPFTRLPYPTAFLAWDFLNILILLSLQPLLRSRIPVLQRTHAGVFFFLSLAFFPVFIALLQGQDIILLLLLFTLAFVALKKRADFGAGCCLGLGLFRFHYVLPFMVILLLKKKYKAVLGFISVALVLGAISIVLVGWKGAVDYPNYVLHVEQTMAQRKTAVPTGMPNLRGLLDSLIHPGTSRILRSGVLAAMSLGLIFFCSFKWKAKNTAASDLEFALCVLTTVLVGYHAFAYDLSLLILPLALVTNHVFETHTFLDWRRSALIGPIFLLFFTPLHMLLALRSGRYSLMALVLLVWFWGIAREISRDSPDHPQTKPVEQANQLTTDFGNPVDSHATNPRSGGD